MRQLLDQFDAPFKTVMTLLTSMGIASAQDVQLVRAIQQAGISDGLFGLVAAGTVFFLTSARRSLYDLLAEIDDHDLQRYIGANPLQAGLRPVEYFAYVCPK